MASKSSTSSSLRAEKRKSRELIDVEDAFKYLRDAHTRKAVRGNVQLSMHLDNLDDMSKESGFSPHHLSEIMTIVEQGRLSDSTVQRLVKCLIPSKEVPVNLVLRVVSLLSTEKISIGIQKLLVQWLVIVYDLIQDQDQFHSVYCVLFHFLRSEILCPYICQLLYLMTEREDVQLYRVKMLLSIENSVGISPHILSLLSIYKLYRPDLVGVALPSSQRVLFKQTPTDRKWASYIRRAQERCRTEESRELTMNQPIEHLAGNAIGKRMRDDIIPFTCTVDTIEQNGQASKRHKDRINVEHIKTFKQLVNHLENLQIPSQLGSLLKDNFMQHLFLVSTDPVAPQRFLFWLNHMLQEEFFNTCHRDKHKRQTRVLDMLVNFSDFVLETPFVVETFLGRYMHTWNGYQHVVPILELVARCQLTSFEKLHSLFLEPLKKIFICSPINIQCKIIWSLTELLQNLGSVEWPKKKLQRRCAADGSEAEHRKYTAVFCEDEDEPGDLDTVAEMARFTDDLCCTALTISSSHIVMQHMVLNFYEVTCDTQKIHKIPVCFVPHRRVFYGLLFSNNMPIVARTAKLLCRYRESFEDLRQPEVLLSKTEVELRQESLKQIKILNPYILDVSDTLWRYRAFNSTEQRSVYNKIDSDTLEQTKVDKPTYTLSLHGHQAFVGFAYSFLKQTQPVSLSLHPFTIKEKREEYLSFLRTEGAGDMFSFIDKFITRNKLKAIKY